MPALLFEQLMIHGVIHKDYSIQNEPVPVIIVIIGLTRTMIIRCQVTYFPR